MVTQNKKVENTYSMKKALVLLVSFICYQIVCHAQVMDEHYYQNFLSFPILRDNWLIFIDFSLIQFGLFMDSFVRKEAPCLQA